MYCCMEYAFNWNWHFLRDTLHSNTHSIYHPRKRCSLPQYMEQMQYVQDTRMSYCFSLIHTGRLPGYSDRQSSVQQIWARGSKCNVKYYAPVGCITPFNSTYCVLAARAKSIKYTICKAVWFNFVFFLMIPSLSLNKWWLNPEYLPLMGS